MGKLEYLDALKRALSGLPPEIQARTLAWYEQRFVDGMSAGRSEASIAEELDDPRKIAVTLRANAHMESFKARKTPANALRMLVAGLGLLVFNLFMAIPAIVYASLLVAVYGAALGFYVSGIAITASGLAGANELVLDNPLQRIEAMADGERRVTVEDGRTRVEIGKQGIHVYEEEALEDPAAEDGADEPASSSVVIRRAGEVADAGIRITSDMDGESRAAQTVIGVAMVFGGILLFLISLVVTKYTFIGLKRYVKMNLSFLRGT